jgi:Tfp pilus assembly protein PilF
LGLGHPRLGSTLTSIGTIYLARKQPGRALEVLERALAIRESKPTGLAELAKTRFAVAQALWGSNEDRSRARALADQALEGYSDAGKESDEERAEVALWLRRHR